MIRGQTPYSPSPLPQRPNIDTRTAVTPVPRPLRGFDWSRQWYPLAPASYLSKQKPSSHQVLGRQLAVWHDPKSSRWLAFEDACPHRLAPLSQGWVDRTSGTLTCAYHGWAFDNTGACVKIPQLADDDTAGGGGGSSSRTMNTLRQSKRACVTSYPVREEAGLVWVFLGQKNDSNASSPAGIEVAKRGLLGDWYMRELPISWEFLMENLLDPSHVNFAHHGVIGNRNAGTAKLVSKPTDSGGLLFEVYNQSGGWESSSPMSSSFLPPSLAWLKFPLPGGASASMLFYAVPVAPMKCRIIAGYASDAIPFSLRSLLSQPLFHPFQWLMDFGSHQVLDGDTLILRGQEERYLAKGLPWKQSYYMPAPIDIGVLAFRRWLDENGKPLGEASSVAKFDGNCINELQGRDILDRYEQHTRYCPYCRRAHASVKLARQALTTVAAFNAAAVLQPQPGDSTPLTRRRRGLESVVAPVPSWATSLGIAVGCGVAAAGLWALEQQFVYTGYDHSDRNR